MKRKLTALLALAVAGLSYLASAIVIVDIPHDTSGARPGYWTSDFEAAKKMADEKHMPMMLFWGYDQCAHCAKMKSNGLDSDVFKAWIKKHPILMVYTEVDEAHRYQVTAVKTFTRDNNPNGGYPYMRFYWPKADGTVASVAFTGDPGEMPYKTGKQGEQLVGSLDMYFGSWTPAPDYAGGYFTLTNGTARLEAVIGVTKSVNIPLARTETDSYTNKLVVGSAAASNVIWAKNETNKLVKATLPSMKATAGSTIALKLLASDGKTVKSTSTVTLVNEPSVSVDNPKWLGESFTAGEWTMDLDAALSKAKSTTAKSYTLAFASGELWCPWCNDVQTKVLKTAKFTAWAKENNVNLVLLDNPKRSASDVKDASGAVVSVGTKADGAAPTLLRYDVGSNGKSGAAYLSRKGIEVGTPTTAGTAEYVLQRNHNLLYKGGKLAAPEALRTGYPTFILVNPDGTAAAQLLGACASDRTWGISVDETLARLSELLKLEGSNAKDSKPTTTSLSLTIEETADGGLQVNDNVKFYKLSNVPAGKVTFEAAAYNRKQERVKPVLTVYEAASTLAKATKLASGTNWVNATFKDGANKFLAVSYYDAFAANGSDTEITFTLKSKLTLVPSAAKATFTTQSGAMNMSVTAGALYKLSGFKSYVGFTKTADGLYKADKTATLAMSANKDATVTYQLWTPGTVQFATASATVKEEAGKGTIKVSRTGGSGAATVTVSVDKGSLSTGRVTLSPTTLTWADGSTTAKTVTYTIKADTAAHTEEKFTLTLAKGASSQATIGAQKTFALTVTDTDDPVLPESSYTLRKYMRMPVNEVYPINNVKDGSISVSRDGVIPSGLRLVYDSAAQKLRLTGTPSRAGEYTFKVSVTQRRSSGTVTGAPTTFKVTVADVTALKPGQTGYNAALAAVGAGKYATLPVYGKLGGKTVLSGTFELKVSRTMQVTGKFQGVDGTRVSLRNKMGLISDAGVASVTMVNRGVSATVKIDAKGRATLAISGLSSAYGSSRTSEAKGVAMTGSYGAYAGYYTVTLPLETSGLKKAGESVPTGTGYVILKMNNSMFTGRGKVRYSGVTASGQSFTGYSYMAADQESANGVTWGYVPVIVSKRNDRAGFVLRVRKNAAATHKSDPQVVLAAASATPFWTYGSKTLWINTYGALYDRNLDLSDCCSEYYETTTFKMQAVKDYFADSILYGKLVATPTGTADVEDIGTITIQNGNAALPLRIRFTRTTGLVSGTARVQFANRVVTMRFKGALLIGWSDCGCNDAVSIIDRPLLSGALYYSDRAEGASVKRGLALELVK